MSLTTKPSAPEAMLRCMMSELAKLERTQNRTFGQTLRARARASLTSGSALSSPKTMRSGRVRWRSSTRTDGASPTTRIIGFSSRNECKAFAISDWRSMTKVLSGTISRAIMLLLLRPYTEWRVGKKPTRYRRIVGQERDSRTSQNLGFLTQPIHLSSDWRHRREGLSPQTYYVIRSPPQA